MAEEEKHLSIQQFEQLLEARNQTRNQAGDAQIESVKDANRHLLTCERCRTVLSLLELWDRFPNDADEKHSAERTPTCPPNVAVFEFVAGLTSEMEAETLLEHVAACAHCGPLLRQATAFFAEDFSPDEEETIASLATGTPERQASIASQISAAWRTTSVPQSAGITSPKGQSRRFWQFAPRLAWSVAAVVFLIFAGVFTWRVTRGPDVNQLLAQAYTERRTLELRFTGARYSAPHRERTTAGSMIDRPQSLLDANALISRRLKSDPHNFDWRQAKARADLLEWNFPDAIDTLRQLQKDNVNSLQVKQDLATAYFERAETSTQPSDYGTAAELLGEVLKQDPKDPIALFNRALVYERLFLYHEALNDWQTYLSVDDKSGWANEARTHVRELSNRLATSENQRVRQLLSPHEIASTAAENDDTLDERIEDYLNAATADWLPSVFSLQSKGTEAQEAEIALLRLSRLLAVRHKDGWLADVLSSPSSRLPASGLADLRQALELVGRGQYGAAERVAARAERNFQNSGSRALAARANLERLIALNRTFEGKQCRELESATERQTAESSYLWIQVQLLLESAVCSASGGNLEAAYSNSRRARDLAQSAGFEYLYLRAQGFVAEYDMDLNRAFASNVDGLRVFWQRNSNALRGHQFFEALAMLAENRTNWQLATAFNREAVLAVKNTPRKPVEATARLYLGRAEYHAGFRQEAASEWKSALQSLAALPVDDAVTAVLAELYVNLARSDLDDGRLSDASRDLSAAAPRFLHPGLQEVSIQYFSALARLYSLQGHDEEAKKAWRDAIRRTEVEIRHATSAFDRIRLAGLCKECYESLARSQVEQADPNGAWNTLESYRGTGLPGGMPSSFDEPRFLERHLPEGAVLLSTVELEDGLAIWLVSRKEIIFRRLVLPVSQFHDTAERFAAECSDRNSPLPVLRSDAAQLYRWLILPFAEKLADTKLLIVERGQPSFSLIPFEALVYPDGLYLSERLSIAYTFGIAYLDPASVSPKNLFLGSALLVAGPNASGSMGGGLPPLPEAINEVRELSGLFHRPTILEGPDAKYTVLRREIPRAAVFHFAGHATTGPGRTALLVATAEGNESIAFWPENSSDHLANLRLVFLSACSTAKSGDDDSVNLAGLAESYRLAGSKIVVGNKWIVDSGASRIFAVAFYRELASGSSIPAAAQQGETELRKHVEFEHPYFWSAPTLFL